MSPVPLSCAVVLPNGHPGSPPTCVGAYEYPTWATPDLCGGLWVSHLDHDYYYHYFYLLLPTTNYYSLLLYLQRTTYFLLPTAYYLLPTTY